MWQARFLFFISSLVILAACGSPPPVNETTAPGGFEFLGPAVLPPGFDAQGHRGARGLLPENTLPSFEAALDLGVTTLEMDLHYTQDGQVVIWHDPVITKDKCRLPAIADNGEVPDPRNPLRRILISQQSLATIRAYQCDLNPEPDRFPDQEARAMPLSGQNYGLVTLDELFDFVAAYAASELKSKAQRANAAAVHFNIETKRKPDDPEAIGDGFTGGEAGPFELAILAIVEAYDLQERVIIQSFDHRSLQTIRSINDDIRLAALTTGGEAKLKVYNGYQFDIWSPNARDVTANRLAEAHELGLLVVPWTVNEAGDMARLIEMGVDGLISDRPDLLLKAE